MRRLRVLVMIILIPFGAGLAGCGGGGADVKKDMTTTTVGQELLDLQSAYKKGVITKEEYESTKEKILERK
jgi:uncharacterized membrane protein